MLLCENFSTNLSEPIKASFLSQLGERVKALRARCGISRKALAKLADVSERHVANVETGIGNASIQFLRQLALVLNCSLAEMIRDQSASLPEWLMIRGILHDLANAELMQARVALSELFETSTSELARRRRIALIGLHGDGKSSIGRMLADS